MTRLLAGASLALRVGLGFFWALSALSKLTDVLLPLTRTEVTWLDQFPRVLILGSIAAELSAAALLIAGRGVWGLAVGGGLLAAFTILLITLPIRDGQSCGCLGSLARGTGADAIDPVLRNAVLGAVHVLALAMVAPRRTARCRSTTRQLTAIAGPPEPAEP